MRIISLIIATIGIVGFTLISCASDINQKQGYEQNDLEKTISASLSVDGGRVLYTTVKDTIKSTQKEYLTALLDESLQAAGMQSNGSISLELSNLKKTTQLLQFVDSLDSCIQNLDETSNTELFKYSGYILARINDCINMPTRSCIDSSDTRKYYEAYFDKEGVIVGVFVN